VFLYQLALVHGQSKVVDFQLVKLPNIDLLIHGSTG
jgi:hypothetical protein